MTRCHIALGLAALTVAAWPQTARLRAGFQVDYVPIGGVTLAGAIAAIPGSPESLFAATGSFQDNAVHLVDLTNPASPLLVADGADDLVGADNVLDSGFGSIGGLEVLPTGELIIVDNATPISGGQGDAVFLGKDLNGDGDFLDVVGGVPEVQPLVPVPTLDALTGQSDFTGATAKVAPLGHPFAGDLFVVTADGGGAGELLRFADPADTPTGSVFFGGLDFGGGIAFDASHVFVGESGFPSGGSVHRLQDMTSDGDALDPGESLTLYAGTLIGCSDLALTPADGALQVSAFRPDFTGTEFFSVSASTPEAPPIGLYTPDDFIYSTALVADLTGGAFAPNAGPGGQRLFTAVGNAVAVLEPAPGAGITSLESNYHSVALSPPDTSVIWSGALGAVPGHPELMFAAAGDFQQQQIWRVDLTDPAFPSYRLVADGADDLVGSDGVLDSRFGSVSDIAALSSSEMVIVDSATPLSGGQGDLVFLAVDGNSDGDFLDAGEVQPLLAETTLDALTGQSDFTGASAAIGPDGGVYVLTADGGDLGEVVRIADPTGSPVGNLFFTDGAMGGVDFGAGLAWLGSQLFVGDADDDFFSPSNDRLWQLSDSGPDGDALDPGESAVVTGALDGVTQLSPGPAGTLWRTAGFFGSAVTRLNSSSGAVVQTLATTATTFGDLAFTSTSATPFLPGVSSADRLVVQSTDFGFPTATTFLHVIWPDATVPAELSVFTAE